MLNTDENMTDELLISYLLGEAGGEARQQVEHWIIESPENQRYFEHFRMIWDSGKDLALTIDIDEQAAWHRFKKRRDRSTTNFRLFPWSRIAAVVVTVIGIGYLFSVSQGNIELAATTTPVSKALPDGSLVTLNKNSSIVYDDRTVKLKGEAFFEVKADKKKPFTVQIHDVVITVLGTSFNVTGSEVIVEKGSVKVSNKGQSIILKEQERVKIAGRTMVREEQKDQLYNYYRTHEFVCDDTPLWKLVEVLNKAYSSNITIHNPDIRNLPLTTTFENEPLDNILNIISKTFNIKVEITNNSIILK